MKSGNVNPASGQSGINHMLDPNNKTDELKEDAAINEQESAQQDSAMEASESDVDSGA